MLREHLRPAGYDSVAFAVMRLVREPLERHKFDLLISEPELPDRDERLLGAEVRKRQDEERTIRS